MWLLKASDPLIQVATEAGLTVSLFLFCQSQPRHKPKCFFFRMLMVIILGVPIFRNFMVHFVQGIK